MKTATRSRCLNCGGEGKHLGVYRDCSGRVEIKYLIWHCEKCGRLVVRFRIFT
ncbi:MAG: hypothetical protein GX996_07830 [Firmicutes bacterium]|nr:hypothetical protein [Bacillota bacterium]